MIILSSYYIIVIYYDIIIQYVYIILLLSIQYNQYICTAIILYLSTAIN